MKKLVCLLFAALLLTGFALGEALDKTDISALEDFVGEYAHGLDLREMIAETASGETDFGRLLDWLKQRAAEPVEVVLQQGAGMLAPVLLLSLLGCIGGGGGVRFLVRLSLLAGMMQTVAAALDGVRDCLVMVGRFTDAAAPALSALMTAAGMGSGAALLSPAAAMAGGIAGNLFSNWGLPMCRFALCIAAAGNLSPSFELNRAVRLLRRIIGWGTGLSFTLFTALIALQGNVAASLDGVGVRTAKYAVDSASAVIGSGVSDVWDSYVSGLQLTRSAIGFSGVTVLLAAGIRPLVQAGAAMLLLHIIAVLLDTLGEKTAARGADQMGDVCRMALELCSGALAIATILLGAGMSAGRSILV